MAVKRPFKMTEQRRVLLEELGKTDSHPTADEIYQRVRKRLPKISLGTVYRNLEILSECGMIQKLELSGTLKRFDGMRENHYHARCVRCGRVRDVPIYPIPIPEESASKLTDYKILSHRLEFLGLCPDCRKAATDDESRENLKEEKRRIQGRAKCFG